MNTCSDRMEIFWGNEVDLVIETENNCGEETYNASRISKTKTIC